MHKISGRWHNPKSRPSKKRLLAEARNKARWQKKPETTSSENISVFDDPNISRSEKKLLTFSEEISLVDDVPISSSTVIVDEVWPTLLKELKCPNCNKHCLDVKKSTEYGLAAKLQIYCNSCTNSCSDEFFSSPRMEGSKKFSVNKDIVQAVLNIGKGHCALEKISSAMGLKPMDRKTFDRYVFHLAEENNTFKEEVLQKCRQKVRDEYNKHQSASQDDNGILNIAVSFDGTWQKRGHSSLYGVGCVIDIFTGIVIDFFIASKYCHLCEVTANELDSSSAEFNVWYDGHKSSGFCDKNFDGSANAMEMFAAGILWKRSVERCQMRYTVLLSDGDSKTFIHLKNLKVYEDEGIEIVKEECVNHVSKRLGTALRNKVKECKVKGETIGGKKKGHLTDAVITKLQNYYRNAVVKNAPDINMMKSAIFASLYHCSSTDDKPKHFKCPKGESSWCFFNRAKAQGKKTPSHSTMKTSISDAIVAKVLPVYQRLACDELLKRCSSAKTQNANESLHSVIWNLCSKDVFVSKRRLEIAVTTAVSNFNMGNMASASIKDEKAGSIDVARRIDDRRIRQSKRRHTDSYKKAVKEKKYSNKKANKKIKASEGPTYAPGAF